MLRTFAAYYLGFLPVQFLLAFVEGAAYRRWALTPHDLWYQFGGWVVSMVLWLAVSGLVAVPLLVVSVRCLARRTSRVRPSTLAAILGPVTVLVASTAANGIGVLLGGAWFPFLIVIFAPFAWLLAGALFGYLSVTLDPAAQRSAPAAV